MSAHPGAFSSLDMKVGAQNLGQRQHAHPFPSSPLPHLLDAQGPPVLVPLDQRDRGLCLHGAADVPVDPDGDVDDGGHVHHAGRIWGEQHQVKTRMEPVSPNTWLYRINIARATRVQTPNLSPDLPPADIFRFASTATPGASGGLYLNPVGSHLELIKSCTSLKASFKRQHQTPVPTPRVTPPRNALSPEGKKAVGKPGGASRGDDNASVPPAGYRENNSNPANKNCFNPSTLKHTKGSSRGREGTRGQAGVSRFPPICLYSQPMPN